MILHAMLISIVSLSECEDIVSLYDSQTERVKMDLGLPDWVADWARDAPKLKVAPPGPKSKEIIDKDKKYVSHAYDRLFQFTMTKGSGAAIMDADGNVFLDFSAGISVMNAGWGNPRVVQAI